MVGKTRERRKLVEKMIQSCDFLDAIDAALAGRDLEAAARVDNIRRRFLSENPEYRDNYEDQEIQSLLGVA